MGARAVLRAFWCVLSQLAIASVVCGVASASSFWGQFVGCPVDSAPMLAVPEGGFGSGCVGIESSYDYNLGRAHLSDFGTAALILDFGVAGGEPGQPTLGVVVPPTNGNIMPVAQASSYGILGLEPAVDNALLAVCAPLYNPIDFHDGGSLYVLCSASVLPFEAANSLASIKVAPELAGRPSDFSPAGITGTGHVLTLPLKFHLESALLGKSCYVGSDQDPVVLHINQTLAPRVSQQPDPNGFPVTLSATPPTPAIAEPFGEPGATGCGPSGLLDSIVNAAFGLPSPATKNAFRLDELSQVVWTTAGGSVLSQAYHAALG